MDLYLVTGFLGSGKTKLINKWISHPDLEGKPVMVLQTENGRTKTSLGKTFTHPKDWWDDVAFEELLKKEKPEYLFIETNGFENFAQWLHRLVAFSKKTDLKIRVRQTVHCLNADQYDGLSAMLPSAFDEWFTEADQLLVTGLPSDSPSKKKPQLSSKLASALKMAEKQGKGVHYVTEENPLAEDFSFMKLGTQLAPEWAKPLVFASLLVVALYLLQFIPEQGGNYAKMLMGFVGMMYQAFPFLLAGILVSSWISVYITKEALLEWFPKNPVLATIYGLFGGLALPVCDCAIVPVTTQLMRKGVPMYAAFTFMFAAPLVNPIAMLSTWYAFPENPGILVYRVVAALSIALLSGIALGRLIPQESMLPDDRQALICDCDYCNPNEVTESLSKPVRTLLHAGDEFVKTAPYLIFGALIAAMVQTYGNDTLQIWILSHPGGSLLVMMLFAFVMSVCSSSDAFIARSMVSQFSIQSVMGFLVTGAMLDLKNLALLKRSFSTKQILTIMAVLLTLSYLVISVGNIIAGRLI